MASSSHSEQEGKEQQRDQANVCHQESTSVRSRYREVVCMGIQNHRGCEEGAVTEPGRAQEGDGPLPEGRVCVAEVRQVLRIAEQVMCKNYTLKRSYRMRALKPIIRNGRFGRDRLGL